MTDEHVQNEMRTAQDPVLEEAGVVKGYGPRASAPKTAQAEHRSALGLGLLAALFIVLLACALWAVSGVYAHTAHEQGAVTLRESILQAADQCYAIEGAYPMTLGYLEKRYGLSVNRDGYDVIYEAFASNIAPTVVVRAL